MNWLKTGDLIREFLLLNETCSWKSINDDICAYDNDDDEDECSCIKILVENAYKGPYHKEYKRVFSNIYGKKYEEVIKELMREGKYAIMKSYLTPAEIKWGDQYNQGMGWHRSEDTVHGINPSGGYLTNKKWIFNEDIANIIYDI